MTYCHMSFFVLVMLPRESVVQLGYTTHSYTDRVVLVILLTLVSLVRGTEDIQTVLIPFFYHLHVPWLI